MTLFWNGFLIVPKKWRSSFQNDQTFNIGTNLLLIFVDTDKYPVTKFYYKLISQNP